MNFELKNFVEKHGKKILLTASLLMEVYMTRRSLVQSSSLEFMMTILFYSPKKNKDYDKESLS